MLTLYYMHYLNVFSCFVESHSMVMRYRESIALVVVTEYQAETLKYIYF